MAIRVQCNRCAKRISIDEAFAGGVCRCPYCTAINNVPKDSAARTAAAKRPVQAPAGSGKIPVANRVMLQGFNIVFLVVVVGVVVGGGIFMIVAAGGDGYGDNGNGDSSLPTNPFVVAATPAVAGNVAITAPVVYVLDSSSSMGSGFAYAARMTRVSLQSLPAGSRAAVIVSGEDRIESTGTSFLTMPGGLSSAQSLLRGVSPTGLADLMAALQAAVRMRPTTIVVFARTFVDDAYGIAEKAHSDGIRIITIVPGGRGGVAESMTGLAERADGRCCVFALDQLGNWAREAPGN